MLSFSGGSRIRTDDLKAMILASYQLLHPAIFATSLGCERYNFSSNKLYAKPITGYFLYKYT